MRFVVCSFSVVIVLSACTRSGVAYEAISNQIKNQHSDQEHANSALKQDHELEKLDARIEQIETRVIQGHDSVALPRNAVIKEGSQYFVMAGKTKRLDEFERWEIKIGDNWNPTYLEAKSGISPGHFVLVKNVVKQRQTPLTPTPFSTPKLEYQTPKLQVKKTAPPAIAPKTAAPVVISQTKQSIPAPKPDVAGEKFSKPAPVANHSRYPKPSVPASAPIVVQQSKPKPAISPIKSEPEIVKARPYIEPPAVMVEEQPYLANNHGHTSAPDFIHPSFNNHQMDPSSYYMVDQPNSQVIYIDACGNILSVEPVHQHSQELPPFIMTTPRQQQFTRPMHHGHMGRGKGKGKGRRR